MLHPPCSLDPDKLSKSSFLRRERKGFFFRKDSGGVSQGGMYVCVTWTPLEVEGQFLRLKDVHQRVKQISRLL